MVDAYENPQMMCYALGAIEIFDGIYDIKKVKMTIFQPRRENISTYERTKEELINWAEATLKPKQNWLIKARESLLVVIGVAGVLPRKLVEQELSIIFPLQNMSSNCQSC